MPFSSGCRALSDRALSGAVERPLNTPEGTLASVHCLVCGIGGRACALPIEHVCEVMRPCPVERIEHAPAYVLGVGLIRGEMVPVVDAAALLAGEGRECRRFVILRAGERRVALAVAEVVGARMLDRDELDGLPPLLAGRADLVAHLAVLDGELLEVLESTRLFELAREHAEARGAS